MQERDALMQGISLLSLIYNGNRLAGFKVPTIRVLQCICV